MALPRRSASRRLLRPAPPRCLCADARAFFALTIASSLLLPVRSFVTSSGYSSASQAATPHRRSAPAPEHGIDSPAMRLLTAQRLQYAARNALEFSSSSQTSSGTCASIGAWGPQAAATSRAQRPRQSAPRAARYGASPLDMLWSGGRRTRPDEVTVNIERPSLNSRRISGSIVVDAPIDDVWHVLTDYDHLADEVPNLTQSRLVPHPTGGIRLYQEGAQKIAGFDFRASLVMDMQESYGDPDDRLGQRKITFKLVDSAMFSDFDGEWRLQFNSRQVKRDGGGENGGDRYKYTTKLFYMVYIKPKGPVPVLALEWQIGTEIPNNLAAVKQAAESKDAAWFARRRSERVEFIAALRERKAVERRAAESAAATAQLNGGANAFVLGQRQAGAPVPVKPRGDWEKDETLEAYFGGAKPERT